MSYFRKLAHLEEQLGEERFEALLCSDNTGEVKAFCDGLLGIGITPTRMTVGGRTYEILEGPFALEGGYKISFSGMVECAKTWLTHLGENDGGHILEHQEDIPRILRKRVFVFTDWQHPDDPEYITYIHWHFDHWERGLQHKDDDWTGNNIRLLRRVLPSAQPDIIGANVATSFLITYDQAIGLAKLIKRAVGKNNPHYVDGDITEGRFPLRGTDVRTVHVRVEPLLLGETGELAAERLVASGHTLANIGDLAGFLHDHPEEMERWGWVVALSKDSRWTNPHGTVRMPQARVDDSGRSRYFGLNFFSNEFSPGYGVLVLCE